MCLAALFSRRNTGISFVVHFLPNKPLAPLLGLLEAIGLDAVAVPEHVDVGVGGHLAQGVRHRPRTLDVQVAPPEDRLDPLELREPPMGAKHRSKLRVHASLDPVVRGRKRPFGRERRVEVREQGAGVGKPHQARPGPAEALVGVDGAPVHDAALFQEIRPEVAPLAEAPVPPLGLREGLRMEQLLGQSVQLDARLQLRPRRRLPPDLAEHVEDAPLHPSFRPFRRCGGRKSAAAVGHHHLRRRDARQQRAPRRR